MKSRLGHVDRALIFVASLVDISFKKIKGQAIRKFLISDIIDKIVFLGGPMTGDGQKLKKIFGFESFLFLFLFFGFFISIGKVMGATNMLMTLMNTAYESLMHTCFFIMAISVMAGAISGLFSEFGLIALVNKILSIVMKPIYDLPGAASLGILNCYLSDNPAILTLATEENFIRYFKNYQKPALTNLGTAFGMGLITTTTMMALPVDGALKAALLGNIGAIFGSVVSVRLMLRATKKKYINTEEQKIEINDHLPSTMRIVRPGSVGQRFIEALLDGGKRGVDMGLAIVPGVLGICTIVLLLTNGPGPGGVYTGAAGEGVPVLPWLGQKLSFIIKPLFGFSTSEAIAVPITALGSAGAAIGVVKNMAGIGSVTGNDIAVFTAICMCWSGYLSTHVAMMEALGCKDLTGRSILSHTIGGLFAGFAAHILYMLL